MMIDKIYTENCLDTMKRMPDNFVDLVVTSPPYDNLRTYNGYSFDFDSIVNELFRVMKPGGVVVWIIGDATINGSETGTSFRHALGFMDAGFRLNDTMIWRKINPMPKLKRKRYFDVFEYMFIFTKGEPKSFNPIMQPVKVPGKFYDYTVKKISTGKERVAKSYTSNTERYKDNIWENSIAHNKTNHPAVFPEQLVIDHILSWSNVGDIVYDPFMGSGTTAKAAILTNRLWLGSEISEEYVDIAENRLREIEIN